MKAFDVLDILGCNKKIVDVEAYPDACFEKEAWIFFTNNEIQFD